MPPADPVHNSPIQFADIMAPNGHLSSALALIKRFADNWLQISDTIDYDELVALINALDYLKKDAQQKMSIRRASQASMQTHRQPACVGGANQGVRRSSRRIASAPQYASAGSLFVTEDETESESSSQEYGTRSPILYEENDDEHETRDAAAEILMNHPGLLPVDNDSQADKILLERNCENEISQLRHRIEQYVHSPSPYTRGLVSNEQDECTDVQPVQVLDEASTGQAYQETSATALYQSLEVPEDVENQQFPELSHSSLVHQPHLGLIEQDVSDSLFSGEEFGVDILNNLPSPQFFNEAFGDLYSTSVHDEVQRDVEETATYPDEQHPTNQSHTEHFDDDPTVQGYVDLACRLGFRLPHETAEDADCIDVQEVLAPLVKETPLTSRLLHGILYTLLPGPILIIDFCSGAFDPKAVEGSTCTDFVAIVRRNEDPSPLLVVGLETSKTLFILDSETWDLPSLEISWLPRSIEPHMESTLLSIWIAEAYFQHRPLQNVPSSRDLRIRILEELLAPYQRDYVLEKSGIPSKLTGPEHIDTQWKLARLETQSQTGEVFVPNLENFELEALRESLLRKPSEINRGRCLRILQCVNEIGSPHILESLKLACTRKDECQTYSRTDQPIFDKLFHIHIYLDRQESQSHILVARNRYIKYCYFETYLRAVKALQEEKRNSTQERRRVLARKRTTSFKQGISEILPPTPHTEEIHRVYENLSPSERKRRAPDMVKDEISKKIVKEYGGNEKRIRRNINKYIKDGRVLHHVLRGWRSLDPALLILFPSFGSDLPSLSVTQFGLELEELEEKALSKPIQLKDIDELTLVEAAWFGEVLQARPELLEPVPKAVLDLISNTLTHDLDLQGRDPDSFRSRPLQFFMQ
ncbi:hypothetical protein J3E73DRAFT_373835 [Bipolaris maydis]|nr:hypothetical protein J3E73DRAFT_373835 [Bipolaris maydis]